MLRNTAAAVAVILALGASASAGGNIFGAHLLVDTLDARGKAQLSWARHLVGKGGYVKTLFGGITRDTQGAPGNWKDFVAECYRQDVIPVIRLAGHHSAEKSYWIKPEKDPDGSYTGMAQAVKSVVRDLPRSDSYPLYIEVWNEPNLDLEWTGKANLKEYASFFVAVSKAIRSIGDPRIKVMNGAFALSAESTEECIKADPDFIHAFDVWASHPYPQNHPPEYNMHGGKVRYPEATIDGYLQETAVLEKHGRKNVKVMITETGWPLGNALYEFEGYPPVNESNRARYSLAAFRDFYPKWPEVLAVIPFLFSAAGWGPFNWVDPNSASTADGLPVKAAPQYWMVKALAKPGDAVGSISGAIRDKTYGTPLAGAKVTLRGADRTVTTNSTGDYIFEGVAPGKCELAVEMEAFKPGQMSCSVKAGGNAVAGGWLEAARTAELKGTVVDGMTGAPLAGASVSADPPARVVKTDAEGAFRIPGMPPTPFVVTAKKQGFTTHEMVCPPATETAELTLRIAADQSPGVPNMASNMSFERVADPEARPLTALTWEALRQGRWEVSREHARTGVFSQRLDASPGADISLRQITNYGTIEAGKTYLGSVWVRWRDLVAEKDGGAYLAMSFTKDSGEAICDLKCVPGEHGTSGWRLLTIRGKAPEGARRLSLNLCVKAESGSAWFDDAFIGKLD